MQFLIDQGFNLPLFFVGFLFLYVSENFLDLAMKRKLNGIKSLGYFTLIAMVLLQCSLAKRENKLHGDPKFDVVADEVKEKAQKRK